MNYPTSIAHSMDQGSAAPIPESDRPDPQQPFVDASGSLIVEILGAIRRRALALLLWLLVCLGGAVTYVALAQPEFVANAQVVLESRLRAGSDPTVAPPALDNAQAESQLQVIRSGRNLRYVFDTLKLDRDPAYADDPPGAVTQVVGRAVALLPLGAAKPPLTPEEEVRFARERAFQKFTDRVQVRRLGQSYVLEISFRGLTTGDAARIANSIAAAYIRDQVLSRSVTDQRGTEFLQGRIALIQAEKDAANKAVETGVIPDFQFPDSDARIVSVALEPLTKAYPQTKLVLLLAVFFALVSGIGVIAVSHSFDRTVRSADQVRRTLGVDCLATLPRIKARRGVISDRAAFDDPDSDFARSLRVLRTVLFASGNDENYISVGITACMPGDGRSTVAANLAYLLAASSDRVVLLDADMADPALTARLVADTSVGLDRLILSRAIGADLPMIPLAPALSFVPATTDGRPADPNVFLGSHAMQSALARLDGKRDLIVNLPPLGLSSDAQAVGHLLTGVVLIAAVNRTKLDQLSDAIRLLRTANSRVLGVVLNDPGKPRRSRRSTGGANREAKRIQADPVEAAP